MGINETRGKECGARVGKLKIGFADEGVYQFVHRRDLLAVEADEFLKGRIPHRGKKASRRGEVTDDRHVDAEQIDLLAHKGGEAAVQFRGAM